MNTKNIESHIAKLVESTSSDNSMKYHLDFWNEVKQATNITHVYDEDAESFSGIEPYKIMLEDIAVLVSDDIELSKINASEENEIWRFTFKINNKEAVIEMSDTETDWLDESFIKKINSFIVDAGSNKKLEVIPIDQCFYMLFVDKIGLSKIQELLNKYPEIFQ